VVEEPTQTPGTICASCHATVINPLGFVTENSDALGRMQAAAALHRRWHGGGIEAGRYQPTPQIVSGDQTPLLAPPTSATLLVQSDKVVKPASRATTSLYHARWGEPRHRRPHAEAMRQALEHGGTLVDLMKAAVQTPVSAT
jgi:hypothetical protein